MRILDQDRDITLKRITLYLTEEEVEELLYELEWLSKNKNEHVHFNNSEYTHEITAVIYDKQNLDNFSERSKTIITEDK